MDKIPKWLQSGDLYRNMDDDEEFDVPFRKIPKNPNIYNIEDFENILNISDYFALDQYPISIIYFSLINTKEVLNYLKNLKDKGLRFIDILFDEINRGEIFLVNKKELIEYDHLYNNGSTHPRMKEFRSTKFIEIDVDRRTYSLNLTTEVHFEEPFETDTGTLYTEIIYQVGQVSKNISRDLDNAFNEIHVKEIDSLLDILSSYYNKIMIDFGYYELRNDPSTRGGQHQMFLEFSHPNRQFGPIQINDFNKGNILKELKALPRKIQGRR